MEKCLKCGKVLKYEDYYILEVGRGGIYTCKNKECNKYAGKFYTDDDGDVKEGLPEGYIR